MFTSINRTVFDIPLTWDRTRFEASRRKCQLARKLIETSVNAQFNKQLRDTYFQKLDVEKDISESQERFLTQGRKIRVLDNLMEVAAQSIPDYFDQRMANARTTIQEHCKAIQQILREENEHWQEIHTAIDQNLITSDDLHPPAVVVEQENPLANIHTIDEVDEEEQTSRLLNNKTVTPLLTQMIRKSRLQSIRPSTIEPIASSTTQTLIQSKAERFSVMVPLSSARRTLTVIDTTFVVKVEESNADKSYAVEATPLESISTTEVEATPSYSQPKPPARLYFSPTLLQDDEEPELVQAVLSTIDQNRTNNQSERISSKSVETDKSKPLPRRFGQTFLLDHLKAEAINQSQDVENIRPNIPDVNPFLINTDPSLLMQKQPSDESHHSESSVLQRSMIYSKRRTCAAPTKVETEPIHNTRRATRNRKQPEEEAVPKKRQTRKRKQSVSDDGNNNTVALRKKKKAVEPSAPKKNTRKPRATKMKEIPIREPSPLPIIDRSKHYSTRFSTRSHRFNNFTLSTTAMADDIDDPPNQSKRAATRLRAKSVRQPRKRNIDDGEKTVSTTRSKVAKNPAGKRAKSMMATKNRKK